ncbi:hypothetical protein Sjap_004426 [Stephania japonica]|uniref:BZIP domain-containing protein n=1 Tax=Stephania japonica TaxID=461633 RepID=A0AAP0K289_9MAGN
MRVGSSVDIEAHRLKNRLRQQRYRARKREEKFKRDAEIPMLAEMSISSLPCASDVNPAPWHDISPLSVDNPDIKNGASPGGSGGGVDYNSPHEVHSPVDIGSVQIMSSAEQDHQQSYADPLLSEAEGNSLSSLGEHHISEIQDPLFQVERSGDVSNQNMPMVIPEQDEAGNSSYVMARRLKNRERQRRYRARKRLEADLKRAQEVRETFVTRVHCKRNWKEDARRAVAPDSGEPKSPEVHYSGEEDPESSAAQSIMPNVSSKDHQQQASLLLVRDINAQNEDNVQSECATNNAYQFGRRDWKMDARSKVA